MSDEIIIGAGGSAALDILSASAVRAALVDAAEGFHRAQGVDCVLRFDTSGGILKRIGAGETPSVMASALEPLQALAAQGLIDTPVAIGASRIALGLRDGETPPDISTVEKFRRLLLDAPAFARGDPAGGGTAGNYLEGVLDKLGILEATRAKSILRVGGYNVMKEVAEGRAAFGLTQSTEIKPVAGVEIAAYLPAELQLMTTYAVALGMKARDKAAPRAFLAYLQGEGAEAFARAGFGAP